MAYYEWDQARATLAATRGLVDADHGTVSVANLRKALGADDAA